MSQAEGQAPVELILIGLVLCAVGAALLIGRQSRFVRDSGRPFRGTSLADLADRWPMIQGIALLAGGALLLGGLAVGWLMGLNASR
jgi:hypothetical protein